MTIKMLSGDTFVGASEVLESFLVLSGRSPRRLLLPVIYKFPSLRSRTAYFIQSLIIHERLYFIFPQEIFTSILSQSNLESLSNLLKPLDPSNLIDNIKESRAFSTDGNNMQLAYARLKKSPAIAVDHNFLDVFNLVFAEYAADKNTVKHSEFFNTDERRLEISSMLHNGKKIQLKYSEGLVAETTGLALSSLDESDHSSNGYQLYANNSLQEIQEAAKPEVENINKWIRNKGFSVDVPLVFGHVVQKARKRGDLISAILDVRNSKQATAFRRQCSIFDEALKSGDDKTLHEMIREIKDKTKQLKEHIEQPSIGIDISFPLAATINLSETSSYLKAKRKHHLLFINQLYEAALISSKAFDRFSQII